MLGLPDAAHGAGAILVQIWRRMPAMWQPDAAGLNARLQYNWSHNEAKENIGQTPK
jgi:hypothetical protein